MPESPRLDHLNVSGYVESRPRAARGMGTTAIRPVDRQTHGKRLIDEIEAAFARAQRAQDSQNLAPELKANGTYLTLEGAEVEFGLKLDSLTRTVKSRTESRKAQWILLSVHPATEGSPERATIWVADEFRKQFLRLFRDYLTKNTNKGNPENNALVANISRVRSTFLDDLWTSKYAPTHRELTWWELWLDRHRERPGIFDRITRELGIEASDQRIVIDNSAVVRVRASWNDLLPLIESDLPLMEIRCPSFIDTIEDLTDSEQLEYASDLVTRIFPAPLEAPAVCHLDSGVFRTHILLEGSLESGDQHSIFPESSGHDPYGHGTSMAGIALYGQHLDRLLEGTQVVHLRHRLESVRIIPQKGEITRKDYASATIDAISCSETNEDRQRAFCMPVSTKSDTDPGQPTLWSTSIDALAAGSNIYILNNEFSLIARPNHNTKRLIIVSTANVNSYDVDHLANSDISPIEDPGQSWNALTVGAFTQLDQEPHHPIYTNYTPLAPAGELSPHSRTSLLFGDHLWPIKPEICLEGGNVLTDGQGFFETRPPVLSLRSTGIKNDVDLTSANATSAATAQAARLAALTMSRYPSYWPETVRALLVHEARWTERMRTHLDACETKSGRARLLRRYGWGAPTEEAVLTSSPRAVTMVVQDEFHPFDETYAMRELRLHSLPWPRDVLQSLGEADVRLRITLSYFIEPSATRRGWKGKYTYASYGLRFDLKASTDITVKRFLARVNRQAQEEEDEAYSSSESHSKHWLLGTRARHYGSLHQDDWQGTCAELAACDHIAVYPVGGWWKNNRRRDRRGLPVRYALLVSLNTSAQGADLYTPIASQLSVPVTPVPIEV